MQAEVPSQTNHENEKIKALFRFVFRNFLFDSGLEDHGDPR